MPAFRTTAMTPRTGTFTTITPRTWPTARRAFSPWYTSDARFQQYWLDCICEVVDLYHPDLLYPDGGVLFAVSEFFCARQRRGYIRPGV